MSAKDEIIEKLEDEHGGEWEVYTDSEAEDALREFIRESIWAFLPEFLQANTGLSKEVFMTLQEKHEDSNDEIFELVDKLGDFDQLVKDAEMVDGRGHFLSPYDGEEVEIEYKGNTYYAYRTN